MAEARHIPLRLPLLFGGISNQPPHVRHPSQVEDAENFVFQVAHGATKRPGSEFVATITDLPNALGSGSAVPAADGNGPASCVSGAWNSTYSIAYDITGTDPDGGSISHTSQSATVAQHTSKCLWSVTGTKRSTLTPYILVGLDTTERLWFATFLMVPDSPVNSTALYGNSLNVTDTGPVDGVAGRYPNTGNFGATGNYILDIRNIRVS
jgi:hypothetical protein